MELQTTNPNSIADLAEIMKLDRPIRTAYMRIAAINIGGNTLNSTLDIPLEMNKGQGTFKRCKPWDPDQLQEFK